MKLTPLSVTMTLAYEATFYQLASVLVSNGKVYSVITKVTLLEMYTPVHSRQLLEWRLQWCCTAVSRSGGCEEREHLSAHTQHSLKIHHCEMNHD